MTTSASPTFDPNHDGLAEQRSDPWQDADLRLVIVVQLSNDHRLFSDVRGQILGVFETRELAQQALENYAAFTSARYALRPGGTGATDSTITAEAAGHLVAFHRGTEAVPQSVYLSGGTRPYHL